jgi:hypothetical protein
MSTSFMSRTASTSTRATQAAMALPVGGGLTGQSGRAENWRDLAHGLINLEEFVFLR